MQLCRPPPPSTFAIPPPPPGPDPILISDSESEVSESDEDLLEPPSQCPPQDMSTSLGVPSPVTPRPDPSNNAANCTQSPGFINFANSPAVRILSALDLHPLVSPSHMAPLGEVTPRLLMVMPIFQTVTLIRALPPMCPQPALKFQFPESDSGCDFKNILPPLQPKHTWDKLRQPRQPRAEGVLDHSDRGWQDRQYVV